MGNNTGDQPRATVRLSPLATAVISGVVFACMIVALWYSPKALVATAAGIGYAWITWLAHHLVKRDRKNGR